MRLRTLFFTLFTLPALTQVWLPGGTQIRLWLKKPASLYPNNRDMYQGLERVDPSGKHTTLPFPKYLRVQGPPTYWNGCAFITGHRHHPAMDHMAKQSNFFPTEVWISRDFKTWQPFAKWGPDAETRRTASRPWSYGNALKALHPLDNEKYLGELRSELAIFHREKDGTLVWERNLNPALKGLLLRTSKGFVLLPCDRDQCDYWVLDALDASVVQHGILKNPKPMLALARPDGCLLMVLASVNASQHLGENDAYSNLAADHLVQLRRRHPSNVLPCEWLLLDPSTGLQTPMAPPAGLPTNIPWDPYRLQFRDPQNLEW